MERQFLEVRFIFLERESFVFTETRVFWCNSFNSEIDPCDSYIARADGIEGTEILE